MTTTEAQRAAFHDWIQAHARGTLDDEITAALAEVVQSVQDRNKKGAVLIELLVEPTGARRANARNRRARDGETAEAGGRNERVLLRRLGRSAQR